MTQQNYFYEILSSNSIALFNFFVKRNGLMFLDIQAHRDWQPTGACYYYCQSGGQPVWWSYNFELLRQSQIQHGGFLWDSEKNLIKS